MKRKEMFIPDVSIRARGGAASEGDEEDDTAANVETLFAKMWWGIGWHYSDATVEREFLRYHEQYMKYIDFGMIVTMMLFCVAIIALYSDSHFTTVVFSAILAVMLLCSCSDLGHRWWQHRSDALCVSAYEVVEKKRRISLVHEITLSCLMLLTAVLVGIASYKQSMICESDPSFFRKDATLEDRHGVCIHSVFPYPFATLSVGVLTGRPRAFVMSVCAAIYVCSKYATRKFVGEIDTTEEMVWKIIFDVVIVSVLVACQLVLELTHRHCFEQYVRYHHRKQEAHLQKQQTDSYLALLLPHMLYARITTHEHYEDTGTSVTVVIVSVIDLAKWVPLDRDPDAVMEVVERLSSLMSSIDDTHKEADIERIRITGDEFVAVSNLIVPTLNHALRIATFAAKVHQHVVDYGVPVRCAFHTGSVTGTVVGEHFVRYEISGEGFDTTRAMLQHCAQNEVILSSASAELLRDRVVAVTLSVPPLVIANGTVTLFYLRGLARARASLPMPTPENASPLRPSSPSIYAPLSGEYSNSNSSGDPRDAPSLEQTHQRRVHWGASCELPSNCANTAVGPVVQEAAEAEVALTTEVDKLLAALAEKLQVESCWYGGLHFHSADQERAFASVTQRALVVCGNTAFLVLFLVVSIALFVECRGFQDNYTPQLMVVGGGAVSAVGTALLAVGPSWLAQIILRRVIYLPYFFLLWACLFASSATKSTLISNDITFLCVVTPIVLSLALVGFPWELTAICCLVASVVPFVVCALFFEDIVRIPAVLLIIFHVVTVIWTLRWQELYVRQRYGDETLIAAASESEQADKELLISALSAAIPAPLVSRVLRMWSRSARPRKGHVERVPNGVVALLKFRPHLPQAHGPTLLSSETCATPEDNSQVMMAAAERVLRKFHSLTITKIVGDTIVAAGAVRNAGCDEEARREAVQLAKSMDGLCTVAVAQGSLFVVVTGSRNTGFFLLGPALCRAVELLERALPLSISFGEGIL